MTAIGQKVNHEEWLRQRLDKCTGDARRGESALRRIAAQGCSRLHPPSHCRREPGGYPRAEWCNECIAADGLGLPVEWFVLR